jgi:hypothetical protein
MAVDFIGSWWLGGACAVRCPSSSCHRQTDIKRAIVTELSHFHLMPNQQPQRPVKVTDSTYSNSQCDKIDRWRIRFATF